ncbi:MAG: winged helix-turn-helix transcriptional regulator [archaeon]|nr:winged helix-turn-helix transcriptional regulator [archaeon]
MDETDFIILKKLMENSRVTFRELAEIINMSVSSTHKRINKLVDNGVIKAFFARPSILALKYLQVLIYGTSSAKSLEVVSKELGQHECVENVAIATGKIVYVSGILRDLSELQDYSTFVSKTAQISEPFVGIINIPYITSPEPLTTIDYKILKSLNKDARKPITDIADEVGLTAKTVKKRLDRMRENYLVELSIQMEAEYNLVTGFHISLKEGTNINKIVQNLHEKYGKNVIGILNYSNVPNFLSFYIWTIILQDSQKINEELHDMGFKDIIPFIFLKSDFYDTWVEQLLRTK